MPKTCSGRQDEEYHGEEEAMKQHRRFSGILWVALSVATLTACGGGGGDDDTTFSDNASLSALTISAGPFDPVFSRDQTSYTIDLDVTVSETTVTPTAEDSNIDSLSINGTVLASGDTSAPIPLVPGENVIEVVVTAEDGTTMKTYTITATRGPVVNNHTAQRVVFIADRDTEDTFELYSVLDDGSAAPAKLSGTMVTDGDVKSFRISPDRTLVAYLADQDTNGATELYVAPVDGSAPAIKLSPLAAGGRNVKSMAWSPAGDQLLFLGDIGTRGIDELYRVDKDGNNPGIVNGSVGSSVEIGDYAWSPDGSRVAYEVYNRNKPWEVIGVNSHLIGTSSGDAGFSVRISDTLAPPRSIESFAWSADNSSVAYLADQDTAGIPELYVSTAGVTASDLKLSHDASTGISAYAWAPDGLTIAYTEQNSGEDPLYSSAADASVRGTRLSQSGVAVSSIAWSSDSSKIAYLARPHSSLDKTVNELFWSAADASSTATLLSGAMAANGGVKRFLWSPDASSIAYLADQENDEVFELYLSTLDGAVTAAKRSGTLAADGDVEAFSWSPDGNRLAFRAESDAAGVSALFTSLADGSRIATRISQTTVPAGRAVGVFSFDWANDSEAITYHGAETAEGRLELYTGLANGHVKGYPIAGDNIRPAYAYNENLLSSNTYHDEVTELFRDGSWGSEDREELCGLAYHEQIDALFISRCARGDHSIFRYSFVTAELDEVYRYPSQNDYGMRVDGDDLYILRTYDKSVLRLTGLDRPRLSRVADYLAGLDFPGMEEKYDLAVFDNDFYLVAGNALGSAQHNGIHVLQAPNYNVVSELVGDVAAGWPDESFSYSRSIIRVTNGPETHLVVATGAGGNLERWGINGVFANEVAGFGSSYLQKDSANRVYTAFSNVQNSSITRWDGDLTNQETFGFTSELNSGDFTRFTLRETASDVEVYLASFRDRELHIDRTTVPQ